MYVKIFDEDHERDLEMKINEFFGCNPNIKLIDIKYQVATLYDGRDQIYCFSAMIIYEDNSLPLHSQDRYK